MHRPEYIQLIKKVALKLSIDVEYFSGNWAIQLKKGDITKFIVGYALPLNDSTCFKIAGNKNLCSEILTANNIANVPHQLVLSPSILEKRKSKVGNFKIIQQFISENDFPLLIKKNNSSKGEGVYMVHTESELENTLSKIYATDVSLCLSPFRANVREYRNIVLDGECLLSYEKKIPFIVGDGKHTVIELLSEFLKRNKGGVTKAAGLFDISLIIRFDDTPKQDEIIFLQWKHNRFAGTKYEVVENNEMKQFSVNAAKAINGRFVSVDVIQSEKFGLEVMEINSSVVIHFPIQYPSSDKLYDKEMEVYLLALKKTFGLK